MVVRLGLSESYDILPWVKFRLRVIKDHISHAITNKYNGFGGQNIKDTNPVEPFIYEPTAHHPNVNLSPPT
jgi:hypothetical protein